MNRFTKYLAIGTLLATSIMAGCDTNTRITQQEYIAHKTITQGKNLRIKTIGSRKHYWIQKQKEIIPQIRDMINKGQYEIVSIKTCYSDSYLTSAAIQYKIGQPTNPKKLRVRFIQSDKHYWKQKQM